MKSDFHATVGLLAAFMLHRGTESWRAKFLSHRMVRAFDESAFGVIGAFLLAEWSFTDIYMLDQVGNRWRNDPRRPLQLEKLLLELDFFPIVARRLSWQYAIYCSEPEIVRTAVQTFLDLGLRHNVLYEHTMRRPYTLALSREEILAWQKAETDGVWPLERKMSRLPCKRLAEFNLEPVSIDWSATDIRLLFPEEIAALPETKLPPPDEEKPRARHKPNRTIIDRPAVPIDEDVLAVPPKKEEPTVDAASLYAPSDEESTAAQPLIPDEEEGGSARFVDEEYVAACDTSDLADESDDPTSTTDSALFDDLEMVNVLKREVPQWLEAHDPEWFRSKWETHRKNNAWLDDNLSPVWEIILLLKRWFDLHAAPSGEDPRLAFVSSLLRNENLPAQKRLRELRLKSSVLNRMLQASQNKNSKQDKDAKALARELKLVKKQLVREQKLVDPAAFVHDLHVEAQSVSRRKKDRDTIDEELARLKALSDRLECFANPGSFLHLEPEVAFLRLYMARSILEYDAPGSRQDFLLHPEFLLHPFEQIVIAQGIDARGLSIPPPPSIDMQAIQKKCTELRFRVNEVKRYTEEPWKKPYIDMLLEPSREKFMKRLARYLSGLSEQEKLIRAPRARRSRRKRTAFSTLAV
ncbi:MAG: hypothetical protein RDU25_03910 [Patescibacteria group bacterium]|nr:hypothetical protein [Patescibacteria group bacterium]